MLSHAEIWSAIDALAQRLDMSPSALAKLDPTSFNRSKRLSTDNHPRPRWPSTETIATVLAPTGVGFGEFAGMANASGRKPRRGVPLIGVTQAGGLGFFDAGFPLGQGWDEVEVPGGSESVYA